MLTGVWRATVSPYPWDGASSEHRVNVDELAAFLAARHEGKFALWHLW